MLAPTPGFCKSPFVGIVLLSELFFLFLHERCGDSCGGILCFKQEGPERRHEGRSLGFQEPSKVNLHDFWVGRLRPVLQKPHDILDHDLVLKSNEFDHFFRYPRAHDREFDLAHVNFTVKLWGKLDRLE